MVAAAWADRASLARAAKALERAWRLGWTSSCKAWGRRFGAEQARKGWFLTAWRCPRHARRRPRLLLLFDLLGWGGRDKGA
jgi:hypothetical protein